MVVFCLLLAASGICRVVVGAMVRFIMIILFVGVINWLIN